jgi:hypothetical protein
MRDLSRPLGTVEDARFQHLQEMFEGFRHDLPENCLYRIKHSNSSIGVGYLVNMEPFTKIHIDLNGNKFELSHRLFVSIQGAWEGSTTSVS